jgi:hypothetical protein
MDQLRANLAFAVVTRAPEPLRSLLKRIGGDPKLRPDYWGTDERKREPWVDDIWSVASSRPAYKRYLFLWRTKAPRYSGGFSFTLDPVNELELNFDNNSVRSAAEHVFATFDQLVNDYGVAYGFIHPIFLLSTPESEAYNRNSVFGTWDIEKKGLASALARNYFGPWLVDQIGRDVLLAQPHAHVLPCGGIRVDLADRPWEASFEVLAAAQQKFLAALRQAGLLAEGPSGYQLAAPAPSWKNPEWHRKKP